MSDVAVKALNKLETGRIGEVQMHKTEIFLGECLEQIESRIEAAYHGNFLVYLA